MAVTFFRFLRFVTLFLLLAPASCLNPKPSLLRGRQDLDSAAVVDDRDEELLPSNQTHRKLGIKEQLGHPYTLLWTHPKDKDPNPAYNLNDVRGSDFYGDPSCVDKLKIAETDRAGFGYKRDCKLVRTYNPEDFYYSADPFDRRFDCCVKGNFNMWGGNHAVCHALSKTISWEVCGEGITGKQTLYPKAKRDEQFDFEIISRAKIEGKLIPPIYSYESAFDFNINMEGYLGSVSLDRMNKLGTSSSEGWNKLEINLSTYTPSTSSRATGNWACDGHNCAPVSFCNKRSRTYSVPEVKIWQCAAVSKKDYNSDAGITVRLFHSDLQNKKCAYVDTFGVTEELKLTDCSNNVNQKFRVFPGDSGSSYVLRPAEAVTYSDGNSGTGLDVCVNESGQTQDCGADAGILSFPDSSLSTGKILLGDREYIRVEEVSGCCETLNKFYTAKISCSFMLPLCPGRLETKRAERCHINHRREHLS